MTKIEQKVLLQRAQTKLAKVVSKAMQQMRDAQAEVDRLKGTR